MSDQVTPPAFASSQIRSTSTGHALISLNQTLLKLTCPDVPNIYQSNELLQQFLLASPDNHWHDRLYVTTRDFCSLIEWDVSGSGAFMGLRGGAIKLFLFQGDS